VGFQSGCFSSLPSQVSLTLCNYLVKKKQPEHTTTEPSEDTKNNPNKQSLEPDKVGMSSTPLSHLDEAFVLTFFQKILSIQVMSIIKDCQFS
jgi:hypothetical protein